MKIAVPQSYSEWEGYAPEARAALWSLLGDLPPMFTPTPTITAREARDGYRIESLEFDNGAGATVYGTLLLPANEGQPAPAVLYHHLHGGKYALGKDELWSEDVIGFAPGPALVRAGFVVLAIDAYGFNQRETQGPAGERERGAATEQALFKKFVWEGSTLWGMMVRDDQLALNYLLSRAEVDPQRVGATGMSLGGSRTTWLGALDERLKVVIPVAQMTRYEDFGATGNYNLHSIYYYVPGFLKAGFDMEILTSLVAPRAQMILIGDSDPLSPIAGVRKIIDFTRQVYGLYGAEDRFRVEIQAGMAHKFTPTMFAQMLEFLRENL
ncbi:MAG: dienelactone hydrolase [Chloroflexi bacterium]|nr:dienelactone hydrolase [Chloroflexota bacterium]